MPTMRLQKYLSRAGICSRRKGEAHILAGRVRVNKKVVTQLGSRVDPHSDIVEFDDRRVVLIPSDRVVYIALHKPKGYVTSCSQEDEKLVLELVNIAERVYPVGRLDKDSSGLLLLTNNGELHHRLSHPSFDHEKEYLVTVSAKISDTALKKMTKGVVLRGRRTRPAKIERLSARKFRIVLKQGRNRQIRRMVRHIGRRVHRLKRIRIANVHLGPLPEGTWRHLTSKERQILLRNLNLNPKRSPGVTSTVEKDLDS
jgi:23S rRNA pseudouridine2605 synthase/23S rRNA pseudouridine2604 synthase